MVRALVNYICRPGATEQHISQHPYGYFTEAIHLDVHTGSFGVPLAPGYAVAVRFILFFLCSTRKTNNSQYRHGPSLFGRLEKNGKSLPHSDMGRRRPRTRKRVERVTSPAT